MRTLLRRLEDGTATVAGVLSGTSGDGIDVAICRFTTRRGAERHRLWSLECTAFETSPFPSSLADRVRAALDASASGGLDASASGGLDARGLALLSRDLGQAFGRAARELAASRELALDLVGSHGLTVWHHDGCEPCGSATLQLGDGDFVAEAAGCAVVSDFRQRDIACGGQGAPISALADDILFAAESRPLGILNLGGMSNITWLGAAGEQSCAFDTGPAGSLLDGLARRLLDAPFDDGGRCAARGRADRRWVEELLTHPFFDQAPPKRTATSE